METLQEQQRLITEITCIFGIERNDEEIKSGFALRQRRTIIGDFGQLNPFTPNLKKYILSTF